MLFGESTNHANTGLEDATPMDVSLVDLSMHDIQPDVEKPHINPAPTTRKASTSKPDRKRKPVPPQSDGDTKNALLQLSMTLPTVSPTSYSTIPFDVSI